MPFILILFLDYLLFYTYIQGTDYLHLVSVIRKLGSLIIICCHNRKHLDFILENIWTLR